jgi:lipopolysaccharide export system permease protein
MLATLITYGRLSSDSELIAMRGCGISLYRIIAPALFLSIIVTGITFSVTEFIVPAANYQATSILVNSIQEEHPFWQNKDIFVSCSSGGDDECSSNCESNWRARMWHCDSS